MLILFKSRRNLFKPRSDKIESNLRKQCITYKNDLRREYFLFLHFIMIQMHVLYILIFSFVNFHLLYSFYNVLK